MAIVKKIGGLSVVIPTYREVSLTNILTNGNFASTTGWTATGASFSVASNEATFLANSQNDFLVRSDVSITNAHKYYFCGSLKAASASVRMVMSDVAGYDVAANSAGSGAYEFLGNVFTAPSSKANAAMYVLNDLRASGWDTLNGKYYSIMDITASFGAGYEPTAAQMARLMEQFPNKYLDGTQVAKYDW
jgi:hypothetical protein